MYTYPNASEVRDKDTFHTELYKKKEFFDYKKRDEGSSFLQTYRSLFPHQVWVKHFMSPNTPYRNLLLFHSTGSGKTCSAIQIAEQYRPYVDSYKNKVLIITSNLLKSGYIRELEKSSCLKGMDRTPVTMDHTGMYEFRTYQVFYIEIQKILRENTPKDAVRIIQSMFSSRLIIVDEFHKVKTERGNTGSDSGDGDTQTKDSPIQKRMSSDYLLNFRETLLMAMNLSRNSKLLLMSATPILNGNVDLRFIVNLFRSVTNAWNLGGTSSRHKHSPISETSVKPLFPPLTNESLFTDYLFDSETLVSKQSFRETFYTKGDNSNGLKMRMDELQSELQGMVSYIHKTFDVTVNSYRDKWNCFPNYTFPYRMVFIPMDKKHAKAFLDSRESVSPDTKTKTKLQVELGEEEDGTGGTGVRIGSGTHTKLSFSIMDGHSSNKLKTVSKLLKHAENSGEKVFLSTDLIKDVLNGKNYLRNFLKNLGYEEFRLSGTPDAMIKTYQSLPDKKRYVVIQGSNSSTAVDMLDASFNQKSNRFGDKIRIVIGTSVLNEGVTLKSVRQTHLLYINTNYNVDTIDQIFGRSNRADSHDQFDTTSQMYTNQFIHAHVYHPNVDSKCRISPATFRKHKGNYYKWRLSDNTDSSYEWRLPTELQIWNMLTEEQKKKVRVSDTKTNLEEDASDLIDGRIVDVLKMYTLPTAPIMDGVDIDPTLQISIKEMLISKGYFSLYYYPFDLYTYMIAFDKHIENKMITDALASIATDCMYTKSSIRSIRGDGMGMDPVKCYHTTTTTTSPRPDTGSGMDTLRYDHLRVSVNFIIEALKRDVSEHDYVYVPDFMDGLRKRGVLPEYMDPNDIPSIVGECIRILTQHPSSYESDIHTSLIEKRISCPNSITHTGNGGKEPLVVKGYAELVGSILFFRVYETGAIGSSVVGSTGYSVLSRMGGYPTTSMTTNTSCSYSDYIGYKKSLTKSKKKSFGKWVLKNKGKNIT